MVYPPSNHGATALSAAHKTRLASLPDLAVLRVLSAVVRLASCAVLSVVSGAEVGERRLSWQFIDNLSINYCHWAAAQAASGARNFSMPRCAASDDCAI